MFTDIILIKTGKIPSCPSPFHSPLLLCDLRAETGSGDQFQFPPSAAVKNPPVASSY